MASEWIKVVTNLTEKPEIIQISDATGIDCYGVVGRLIDVWSWASRNCRNDGVTHISGMRHINKITACEAFAEAMVDCGWIMVKDNQMAFINFDRHNSQTAKERALAALRMAKKRGSDNVTHPLRSSYKKSVTRIDKNKGVQSTPIKIPSCL